MRDTIDIWKFRNEMVNHGFTVQGSLALFDYIEQYEQDCGEEMEFDPVGLRCDYTEYKNFEELQKDYDVKDLDELRDYTRVIELPDDEGLIIHVY